MSRPDPLSAMTQGLRRMSGLRLDDITRGFENFANPSAAGMLESLGRTRGERVDNMAAMLRNSAQADIEELGTIFGLAMAQLAEEQAATATGAGEPVRPAPAARRRRDQTAADRRRERRRSE